MGSETTGQRTRRVYHQYETCFIRSAGSAPDAPGELAQGASYAPVKGRGGGSGYHLRGRPRGGLTCFVNAADYVVSHDTESGGEQSDADELPKTQLSGDTEMNFAEHKNSYLEVVQAPGISTEKIT
jgi:hypothetical protein